MQAMDLPRYPCFVVSVRVPLDLCRTPEQSCGRNSGRRWLSARRAREPSDTQQVNAKGDHAGPKKRKSWEQMFEVCKRIVLDGRDVTPDDGDVYRWLKRQLSLCKRGKLSAEKTEKLKKFDVSVRRNPSQAYAFQTSRVSWIQTFGPWLLNPSPSFVTKRFMKKCQEYKEKIANGGDKYGPMPSTTPLGQFCHRMRSLRDRGKLSETQIRLLDEVGFVWSSSRFETWLDMFESLKQYKAEHGHFRIDSRNYPELARWVAQTRYHKRVGKLSKRTFEILCSINFDWEHSDDGQTWEESFAELLELNSRTVHAADFTNTHARLGRWLRTQRILARKGLLDPEREKLLVKNGINIRKKKTESALWEERFQELRAWKENHGDLQPHPGNLDDHLHRWMQRQRLFRAQLSADQERRLGEIGFVWDTEEDWEGKYEELAAFYRNHGHGDVPTSEPLGLWLTDQSMYCHFGRLSEVRQEKLRELGVDLDHMWSQLKWRKMYAKLHAYYKTHNSSDVPVTKGVLGKFVAQQRSLYKAGRLSQTRIQLLEEVNFTFILGMEKWRQMHEKVKQVGIGNLSRSLRFWLDKQRSKHRRGLLAEVQENLLHELGDWDPDLPWETGLRKLADFEKLKGHCYVALEDEGELAIWLTHMRWMQRRGELPADKESALALLGVVFDVGEASYLSRFHLLKEYLEIAGPDASPPQHITDANFKYCKLWSFVWGQRDLYKRGKLQPEREAALRDIGLRLETKSERSINVEMTKAESVFDSSESSGSVERFVREMDPTEVPLIDNR